ncbi:MAG: transglutaminase domain-containing protein [Sedimentisphaerales bacterium]|nr:transglutaminase domain-containing protein [Sedimentisphaerales bacterium]
MKSFGFVVIAVFYLASSYCLCATEDAEYLAIFIDGHKSGYGVHTRIVDGNTVRTSEQMELTMERMGSPVSIGTTETYIETIKGEPLGFEAVMDWSFMQTKMTGKVLDNGKVEVKSVTGQLESAKTIEWPKGAMMAEGLRLMELEKGLVKGEEFSALVFSPSLLLAINAKVIVGDKKEVDLLGRVVTLTEVTTKMTIPMSGEMTSLAYVDDELNALKMVMPMMGMKIEMLACSKEFALSPNDPAELMSKAFIKSPKPLGDLSSVTSIKYKIRPSDTTKNFNIPSTDNQSVEKRSDGTAILTVRPVKLKSDKFPYKGSDKEAIENLKPNRFIQSDNEMIIKLAKEAVGDTKNAAIAVKRIEAFVAKYINDRNLSVGYASAVEVAQSRQGDCTEFAVLTAALCRAIGIPARVVAGVAYVNDFMGMQNAFGGHAWTEAYIAGKWVGLDASFVEHGWGGYDAGHIALAAGAGRPEDFIQMVFSLGYFEIEAVEIQM